MLVVGGTGGRPSLGMGRPGSRWGVACLTTRAHSTAYKDRGFLQPEQRAQVRETPSTVCGPQR